MFLMILLKKLMTVKLALWCLQVAVAHLHSERHKIDFIINLFLMLIQNFLSLFKVLLK